MSLFTRIRNFFRKSHETSLCFESDLNNPESAFFFIPGCLTLNLTRKGSVASMDVFHRGTHSRWSIKLNEDAWIICFEDGYASSSTYSKVGGRYETSLEALVHFVKVLKEDHPTR